ncbi:hypothetical protein [uncultured Methanobacterium sp.]|uniref:hypothetical protein n=1 Tax=uncultured Methanobacterium sp. TaxID=176306 RepID=UPI002AA8BF9D|nr:hypothetical protein [uncultured Methanobacterium sp.]
MLFDDDLILKISDKNFNKEGFVEKVLNDSKIRDDIVQLMLNHRKIMVYHHSYSVISQASQMRPELFYHYWDDFAVLLDHPNSYHRDFGLVLLANLTTVDKENKFLNVFNDYYSHINDEKFMTARKCVQNTAKILESESELTEDITDILLDVDKKCDFALKQKALLKSDIIELFYKFHKQINDKEQVNEFVKEELNSVSPKTRKVAKKYMETYFKYD